MDIDRSLTAINDEIDPDMERVVEFLVRNHIQNVELRTANGRNLLDNTDDELRRIASLLGSNGISVSALASPLFKWYPDGAAPGAPVESFHFSTVLPEDKKRFYVKRAFEVAGILGTGTIRIFSCLRPSEPYDYSLLSDPLFSYALELAESSGIGLALENEPPCYINSLKSVKEAFSGCGSPRLKLWLDIANLRKAGERLTLEELRALSSRIAYFHLKDFDSSGANVPLGKGCLNYKRLLSDIRTVFGDSVPFLSMESRAKDNAAAIAESAAFLRDAFTRKRLRYGIIGCGQTFMKNGGAIADDPDSYIGVVFDTNQENAKKAADAFECEVKQSVEALLSDPTIDVVNIRTPHDTHSKLSLAAITAGKKVLCEKPFCLTEKEGLEVVNSPYYKDNVFVNYQLRFQPSAMFLLDLVEKGALGKILFCSVKLRWWRDDAYFENSWRGKKERAGGMLFNQGAHVLDLVNMICGPVEKATSVSKRFRDEKVSDGEDLFLATVQFKRGALGQIEMTTYCKSRNIEEELFVIGEKGSVKLGGNALEKVLFASVEGGCCSARMEKINSELTNPHSGLVSALNQWYSSGASNTRLQSAANGARNVGYIEAIERKRAISSGRAEKKKNGVNVHK